MAASALQFTGSAPVGDWLKGGKVNPAINKKVLAQHTLLIAPDHARIMAQAGWSKTDVKNYLHRTARMPLKRIFRGRDLKRDSQGNWFDRPDLQWMEEYPDMEVPIAASPRFLRRGGSRRAWQCERVLLGYLRLGHQSHRIRAKLNSHLNN